jgi:protein CpxP
MKKILSVCCFLIGLTAASYAQTALPRTTDPVEKAKGLQKQLNLTNNQTTKIAAIYQESAQKFDKIKVREHGNTSKMMASVGPLRTETIKKIKSVLTPRESVKYDKLLEENRSTGGNGWGEGWSTTK